jgi:hypothetical protein
MDCIAMRPITMGCVSLNSFSEAYIRSVILEAFIGNEIAIRTPKRPITVGCVTLTLFHKAITVNSITRRTS